MGPIHTFIRAELSNKHNPHSDAHTNTHTHTNTLDLDLRIIWKRQYTLCSVHAVCFVKYITGPAILGLNVGDVS